MALEIRKVSNYGTRHPVVARLKVQTHELLQWADLPNEQRDKVLEIYFGLASRLLKCHEVAGRLKTSLDQAVAEFQPQQTGRARNVPHVIGLQEETETFLYECKNYLRDQLGVLDIFFGAKFDEASTLYDPKGKGQSEIVAWASGKFGADDPFTKMMISEHDWVGEMIRKRNAVEHPGGKSGTLHVENLTISPDGKLVLPRWYRDQNQPFGLFPDLETCLDNMLTLGEDMLVSCIHHKTQFNIIQFAEIPADQRRADCPIRIIAQIDQTKLKRPDAGTPTG